MLAKILGDFLSWPALKREIAFIERQFVSEFDILMHMDQTELKRCHKKWQRAILDYIDETEPEEIDGRKIVAISIEEACFDLLCSHVITYVKMPDVNVSIPANFKTDREIFESLVRANLRIIFPLYFAVKRVERLITAVKPDLTVDPRFQESRLFLLEHAVEAIRNDANMARDVLALMDLRSTIYVL